jgi:hypothetical protein
LRCRFWRRRIPKPLKLIERVIEVLKKRLPHLLPLGARHIRLELPPFSLDHGKSLVLALILFATARLRLLASSFLLASNTQ